MKGLTGKLEGEFWKNTDLPDGRCRFTTDDENTVILCYFKNGELQKGPRLNLDRQAESVVIRSNTYAFEGSNFHMEAEIRGNAPGWTRFFIENKLVKQVNYFDSRILDWAIL